MIHSGAIRNFFPGLRAIIAIILPLALSAQDPMTLHSRYDSLTRKLQTQQGDEAGFTLLRMCDYFVRLQNGSDNLAIPLSRRAYNLFGQSKNGFGMAWAKFEEGTAFMNIENQDSALACLQAAKDIPINDTNKRKNELLGTIWDQISNVYGRKGDLDLALNISLKKALPFFEMAGNHRRINGIYDGIAVDFINLKQYDKAAFYYKKILFDPAVNNTGHADAVNFSRYSFCLSQLGQLTEAKQMLDSAHRILNGTPPSYAWAKYHQFKGFWEDRKGLLNSAIYDFDQGIAISRQINSPSTVSNILYFKYDALHAQRQFARAKEVAFSIRALSDSLLDTIPLNNAGLYKILWEAEKNTGNAAAALGWLEKYTAVSDTIAKRELNTKINDLVEQYQSEKKEKEILLLQNLSKQQQITIGHNRFMAFMLGAGVIILALLLILYIIVTQNRKRTSRQKEALLHQELMQKEKEQELKVYNAMLEGQEKERSRLSRELHDGLGGMISGAKMNLQSIGERNGENGQLLGKVIHQIAHAGQELRRIAHNMMPENLLRFGLEFALKDLCEQMTTPGAVIECYCSGIGHHIMQKEQLAIYRIVQELLGNALKYANASKILVQCIQDEDNMSITVEDDGSGFDATRIAQEQGIGLMNVKNRVQYLRGQLDIDSGPGSGTSVNIQIKVHEEKEEADIDR